MPELPEVETIRRTLSQHVIGRPILRASLLGPHLVAAGEGVEDALTGNGFAGIRRRGKYLILDLERGGCLIIHLRMTGQLVYYERLFTPDKHVHLHLEFGSNAGIYFRDVRKFGRIWLLDREDECSGLAQLGPEPFDESFTVHYLATALQKSKCSVKGKILDQQVVAGIGNIYADEVLFASFLHPKRISSSLNREEIAALRDNAIAVLSHAIEAGGTTFRDYRDGMGGHGRFQEALRVFQREGDRCPRCGSSIVRVKCAGRSSFLCPNCQSEE